jgi:hypothetical protein
VCVCVCLLAHRLAHVSDLFLFRFLFPFFWAVRAPFDSILASLKACSVPIVSVDIPSGASWVKALLWQRLVSGFEFRG